MNSATFKAFSALKTPKYEGDAVNSLAVNRWGDVFTLSEHGLSYASLLQKSSSCLTLPLSGPDLQLMSQMTCLKFNSFGTMLLVWGKNAAGVIVLPRTYTLYGELDDASGDEKKPCEFIAVVKPDTDRGPIVKTQWHPYHAEYVVVLQQKGPLQMINVFTGITTSASLSQSIQYSSFSFGPAIGWMALSVFVLGENGRVYVVCPMVPVGSQIPVEVVVQMADSLAYEKEVMGRAGNDRTNLLKLAHLYMSAAFGDMSEEYRAQGSMIRVGGSLAQAEKSNFSTSDGIGLSYHHRLLLEILECPAALQGAMSDAADCNQSSGSASTNKRQNLGSRGGGSSAAQADSSSSSLSEGRARKRGATAGAADATACDIIVLPAAPGERGDEGDWTSTDCAPVVVFVLKDGSSKICLIKGQTCPYWDDVATVEKFPLLHETIFNEIGSVIGESMLLRPLPDLVTVERRDSPFSKGDEGTEKQANQLWSLRADPVLRHCYHMIAHGSGASFLVSVRWLAEALLSMQSTGGGSQGTDSANMALAQHRDTFDGSHRNSELRLKGGGDSAISPVSVIPVFPSATFSSSKANGHPLTAFVVVHDPTFGHIAVFQTSTPSIATSPTSITSVNLTVLLASIAQEQRLAIKMQRTVYTNGDITAAPLSDNLATDRDDALHRSASRILKQSEQALQDVRLQVKQHESDRLSKVEPPTVDLGATWTKLDSEVMTPLEELQQRINLSVDIVRDVYEAQVEMLSGSSSSPSGGLIKRLESICSKQATIDERMKTIAANLEDQVSVCAGIMAFSSLKARELTTGERAYKAELARCENIVTRLDSAIQSLESIQIQRTKVSRGARNNLTSPNGMQNRLEQAQLSPVASPSMTQRNNETIAEDTTEMQSAFMSMGLKSKSKTAEKRIVVSANRPLEPDDSSSVLDISSSSVTTSQREGALEPSYGEFNVYSTHAPFVTPVRGNNRENADSAGRVSSFASPGSSAMSTGKSGHWTVHNFSSTTPHRGTSKWSVNRAGFSRVAAKSPFKSSHKRRQDFEAEESSGASAKKHIEVRPDTATSGGREQFTLDKELLNKLAKDGSDIEYMCKEVEDVEKRLAELTNATLRLPGDGRFGREEQHYN